MLAALHCTHTSQRMHLRMPGYNSVVCEFHAPARPFGSVAVPSPSSLHTPPGTPSCQEHVQALEHQHARPVQAIDIAIGPPCPELHPQQPGSGLLFGNQIDAAQPRRFIFKKAHLLREDFRIFDAATKRLVAVSHHHGKNPYESLDPLGVGHTNPVNYGRLGEMESLCRVTGARSWQVLSRALCHSVS